MNINNIILENYRIYYGRNVLALPKIQEKNLHIISGNNGFGKTTLLSALLWCLYGRLMQDVDESIKRLIRDEGGYKQYALASMNRLARIEGLSSYSVTIILSDTDIPPIPCKEVIITRTLDISRAEDSVEILIDGKTNELTKQVGHDLFINDFILPREIAKFFFFDAEKIVFLAEMRSLQEKKNLSQAYSEVLGIKKYVDLKNSLEDLRIRFRRNSATQKDKSLYDLLQNDIYQLRDATASFMKEIENLEEQKVSKRHTSEQLQEKLIREGNSLSMASLQELRVNRDRLAENLNALKLKLRDLMDLSPFVIAGDTFAKVKHQLDLERSRSEPVVSESFVASRVKKITVAIEQHQKRRGIPDELSKECSQLAGKLIYENFRPNAVNPAKGRTLHEFSNQEFNEFQAIYSNISTSFSPTFREIVREHKICRLALNKVVRRLSEAESKEDDLLVRKIRDLKKTLDLDLENIETKIAQLNQDIGGMQRDIAVKNKQLAEIGKRINLETADRAKDEIAKRLISELEEFIHRFKSQKKQSLELRIHKELNRLFHKTNFIDKVLVDTTADLIEIHLYNNRGEVIPKESLSKGEQQLYATALLKALVDESGIKFPIFIDSPLQKFDRQHSRNIITEFYPKISEQVVLLPLLDKELTLDEYEILLPNISQIYLIKNLDKDRSTFLKIENSQLFSHSKNPT